MDRVGHLFGVTTPWIGARQGTLEESTVGQDDGHEVVEVVSHAAGEPAESLELVLARKLSLDAPSLLHLALELGRPLLDAPFELVVRAPEVLFGSLAREEVRDERGAGLHLVADVGLDLVRRSHHEAAHIVAARAAAHLGRDELNAEALLAPAGRVPGVHDADRKVAALSGA